MMPEPKLLLSDAEYTYKIEPLKKALGRQA
jgi:hypothetical protein